MSRGNADAWDREQANAYRGFESDSDFSYDPGVMVLPVASQDPKTVKVRFHGGFSKRVVSFTARKNGNPPVVPAPDDTDRETLVMATVTVKTPVPDTTNNGYVWFVSGNYTYYNNDKPRIPGEDFLPAISRPYPVPQDAVGQEMLRGTSLEALQNNISSSDFDRGTYLWPFTVMPKIFFNPNLVI